MNRGITCTLTRPLSARIADANSFSPPASRSSTPRRASPTSPRDAVIAATPVRLSAVRLLPARCLTLPALTAVRSARFLSSLTTIVPFTAASASRTETTDFCCIERTLHSIQKNTVRLSGVFSFWGRSRAFLFCTSNENPMEFIG